MSGGAGDGRIYLHVYRDRQADRQTAVVTELIYELDENAYRYHHEGGKIITTRYSVILATYSYEIDARIHLSGTTWGLQ